MSKIFKGIAKVAKKIFKTIKKVFKKVWSSPLGKVLLFAAVVYTGGVIAGSWGGSGPLSFLAPATSQAAPVAIGGELATAAAAEGGTTALAGLEASQVGALAVGEGGSVVSAAGTAGEAIAAGTGLGAPTNVAALESVTPAFESMAGLADSSVGLVSDLGGGALGVVSEGGVALTEVGAKAGGGILKNIMANMGFGEGGFLGKGGWVQRNKLVSAMGLGGIMNATAPDPYEEADKDRQRRWDGADSLNVDLYSKLRG